MLLNKTKNKNKKPKTGNSKEKKLDKTCMYIRRNKTHKQENKKKNEKLKT